VSGKFCARHRSFFCPCAEPGLYEDEPNAKAAWDAAPVRREEPDEPHAEPEEMERLW
jgi:hypothetical protein